MNSVAETVRWLALEGDKLSLKAQNSNSEAFASRLSTGIWASRGAELANAMRRGNGQESYSYN